MDQGGERERKGERERRGSGKANQEARQHKMTATIPHCELLG